MMWRWLTGLAPFGAGLVSMLLIPVARQISLDAGLLTLGAGALLSVVVVGLLVVQRNADQMRHAQIHQKIADGETLIAQLRAEKEAALAETRADADARVAKAHQDADARLAAIQADADTRAVAIQADADARVANAVAQVQVEADTRLNEAVSRVEVRQQELQHEAEERVAQAEQRAEEESARMKEELEAHTTRVRIDVRAEMTRERHSFYSRLHHEVGTPLQAIDFAARNLLEDSDSRVRGNAYESIREQVTQLGDLVTQLKRLPEIEDEERPLPQDPIVVRELVEGVVDVIKAHPRAVRREVRYHIRDVQKPLPVIWGDRDLLFLAFRNLLDNAVKYTDDRGRVEIVAYEEDEYVVDIIPIKWCEQATGSSGDGSCVNHSRSP